MADPVYETRPPRTLAEWLQHGDTIVIDDVVESPPVTGVYRQPDPAWVLREASVLLDQLGSKAGAPDKLVTAWTVEMQMSARRLDDRAEAIRQAAAREQTRWTRRRDRLETAAATLLYPVVARAHRWVAERSDSAWED